LRVAAAQTAPVWGDKAATAERVADWIGRAAAEGAELVAFGETFLPGYPFWVSRTHGARFDAPDQKEAYAFYLEAAVELDGPELGLVAEAARDHGVFAYLGVAERTPGGGTVYATLVAVDPERGIVGAHRKVMPTYEERMVWGQGDGHGLRAHVTNGIRVGGLNCWENWLPQARQAIYAEGIDLHVAVWPGSVGLTRDITRFVALEGRCYVLSAGALLRPEDVSAAFPLREAALAGAPPLLYDGGSAVAAPDGTWLVEPVSGEERLVVADLDPRRVREERQNFDPVGHYARPDVFSLTVDRRRLSAARHVDG
jgi:nitrilase